MFNSKSIDLTTQFDSTNPKPFWRGAFIFEVNQGKVRYEENNKPLITYPNTLAIYLSKNKAKEIIEILSAQIDDDFEECVVGFFGQLSLDEEA